MFFSHLNLSCLLFLFNLVVATHLDAISKLLIGTLGVPWLGRDSEATLNWPGPMLSEASALGIPSDRVAGLPSQLDSQRGGSSDPDTAVPISPLLRCAEDFN